jgi:hypothetical protein
MPLMIVVSLLLACLVPCTRAQAVSLVECTEVNLLGPSCEGREVRVESEPSAPGEAPISPLFTPQLMHPNTPPLLRKAYNDPTDANIDAYLDWEDRYHSALVYGDTRVKQRRQQRKGQP